jgi:phycoerythrin-associated linker protein
MEIQSFLEMCAGNWFSQRTNYLFTEQVSENHKSELAIAFLAPTDSALIELCQQRDIAPIQTAGGWVIRWESSKDWDSPKQKGSAILVFIPDAASANSGQILRGAGQSHEAPMQGSYKLGIDEALTLIIQDGNFEAEERIWFASENLRLRTSLFKQGESYRQTAFYSEIRKLPLPPPAP